MKSAIEVLEEMATEFEAHSRAAARIAFGDLRISGIGQAMEAAAERLRARAAELRAVERPASESVEFTAERHRNVWRLISPDLDGSIVVHSEQLTYPLGGGIVAHIRWSESMPPEPIEVRLERKAGAW